MVLILLLVLACPSWAEAEDFINLTKYFGDCPRKNMSFLEMVAYDGYTAEAHNVTTCDGYILEIFRVFPSDSCPKNVTRKPILFVHGLYLCADDCVIPGPGNKSHCYIYADACYEVWVMNCRGNKYSRRHVTMNPDKDMKYWDFDLDDYALKDLKAVVDYVLDKTGHTQLIYIGHSQGVSILLILCSTYTEYNAKILIVFAMSTASWMYHSTLFVMPVQGILSPALTALDQLGVYAEVFNYGGFVQKVAEFMCGHTSLTYPECSLALFATFGYNKWQLTNETIINAVCHEPAGTSLSNFKRWGEIWKNGFKRRDYGLLNLEKYGQLTSPKYELHKIVFRIIFVYSCTDSVCNMKDLAILMSEMPNADCRACYLADKFFGHVDYIYGKSLKTNCADLFLSVLEGGFKCNGTEIPPSLVDDC